MPFNKYGNIDHPIHQETGNFSYLSVGNIIIFETNQNFYMLQTKKDGLRFETDTNDTATKLF